MTDLADCVLPLIRTRADVWRWNVANAHGSQMHDAVDLLEAAALTEEPAVIFAVTQRALASSITVIAHADDSSGIIGDAVRRLLVLHPRYAEAAHASPAKLVDWMLRFQFDGKVDYFELDPVAYAPALGTRGVERYRTKLAEIAAQIAPDPQGSTLAVGESRYRQWVLEWNARRLAVLDHDVQAIIRTHVKDRKVAAWFTDTAKALAEIGETDLAIDWAKQGADFDHGHQAMAAAEYWCALLAAHRPDDLPEAWAETFRRWPTSSHASGLHDAAGSRWDDYREGVMDSLTENPREAVIFAFYSLQDLSLAWTLAHSLLLSDGRLWSDLAKAYEKVDPLAVLPIYTELVLEQLTVTDAKNYRNAARRLVRMRRLSAGTDQAATVDDLISDLRETHRRRPRLQEEFDRAGLP